MVKAVKVIANTNTNAIAIPNAGAGGDLDAETEMAVQTIRPWQTLLAWSALAVF
jgi:hypothetical protein